MKIDLFVSEDNAHHPLFSLYRSLDALSSHWPKKQKYAFPPVKIMQLVLQKVREERGTLLLVASKWPNQLCFLKVVNLH